MNVYKNWLNENLENRLMEEDIDVEWEKIKECVKHGATEAIDTKKQVRSQKGLRIWNEEIVHVINEKQKAFIEYRQNSTVQNKTRYKGKSN